MAEKSPRSYVRQTRRCQKILTRPVANASRGQRGSTTPKLQPFWRWEDEQHPTRSDRICGHVRCETRVQYFIGFDINPRAWLRSRSHHLVGTLHVSLTDSASRTSNFGNFQATTWHSPNRTIEFLMKPFVIRFDSEFSAFRRMALLWRTFDVWPRTCFFNEYSSLALTYLQIVFTAIQVSLFYHTPLMIIFSLVLQTCADSVAVLYCVPIIHVQFSGQYKAFGGLNTIFRRYHKVLGI
jgi:hypothetical protein